MTETWKPVPGYEKLYEVSDQGNVRSLDRTIVRSNGAKMRLSGKALKPWKNVTDGHLMCSLSSPSNRKVKYVHSVVARAFLGPRPEGMEVRHLNDVFTDNRLENLCYGTRSENTYDRVRNGIHCQASKARCKRGHLLSGANLKIEARKNGYARRCVSCNKASKHCSSIKRLGDEQYKAKYANSVYSQLTGGDGGQAEE